MPKPDDRSRAAQSIPDGERGRSVWRQDEHGNAFEVSRERTVSRGASRHYGSRLLGRRRPWYTARTSMKSSRIT